jgi:hypothetical protein
VVVSEARLGHKGYEIEAAMAKASLALGQLRGAPASSLATVGLQEAVRELIAYDPGPGTQGDRIRTLQALVSALLALLERGTPPPAPRVQAQRACGSGPSPSLRMADVSLHVRPDFRTLDSLAADHFRLGRIPGGSLDYPTVFCETLESFFGPILEELAVSESERAAILQAEIEEAQSQANGGGGTWGVNIPAKGCFLNGWLFRRVFEPGATPKGTLESGAAYPHILNTTAHEKLGHGFLTAYTARGRELVSNNVRRFEIARHFSFRGSDDPQEALLREKWNVLFRTSMYSEEGFATWMANRMLELVASVTGEEAFLAPRRLYSAVEVVATLRGQGGELGKLADAIEFIDAAGPRDRDGLIRLMRTLEDESALPVEEFSAVSPQNLRYVLGHILIEKLERAVGTRSVPYAMTVAGNITYGLESIPVSDLKQAIASEHRLSMDIRMALLGTLEQVMADDMDALAIAAREQLSLTPPPIKSLTGSKQ